MANGADPWYVLLPDGRTVRARSTRSLRRSVGNGRIPSDIRVRRRRDEAWLPLPRVPELADLVPRDGMAGNRPVRPRRRTPRPALQTLGIRGLVEELIKAVDSTLGRHKLIAAAVAGLVAGLALLTGVILPLYLSPDWRRAGQFGAAVVAIIALGICACWLTQMTYIELARLRPARRRELWAGLLRHTRRLVLAQLVVGALFAAPLVLLRWLTDAVVTPAVLPAGPWLDALRSFLLAVRLLTEVLGWPIFLMSLLLLGPLVVIEDYSVVRSLREWLGLLRQHLGRIYLYEALAFVLGVVISVPLLLPLGLAALRTLAARGLSQVEEATLTVLLGLALTPLCAYLLVANVFIYLNLRYEFYDRTRAPGR